MRGKPISPQADVGFTTSVIQSHTSAKVNDSHPAEASTATRTRGARLPGHHTVQTVQEENWPREARVGAYFDRRDGVRARPFRFAG